MDFKRLWNLLNVYDLMIIAMLVLTAYNLQKFGLYYAVPIVAITLTACAVDSTINYMKEKKKTDGRAKHIIPILSRSAIITGLILGTIIEGAIWLLVAVAAIAILSKHIIKIRGKHIFNPAIFALFVALFLPVSQSWWGTGNILLIFVLGLVVVYKLKRFHLAAPFLAVHAALMFILLTFNPVELATYLASGSLVFFAFYMLVEPITSPVKMKGRIIFGLLVGIFAAILYIVWLPAMLVGALFLADLCVPLLNRQVKKPANSESEKHLQDEPVTNPNW